jgi:hypothetical protein
MLTKRPRERGDRDAEHRLVTRLEALHLKTGRPVCWLLFEFGLKISASPSASA